MNIVYHPHFYPSCLHSSGQARLELALLGMGQATMYGLHQGKDETIRKVGGFFICSGCQEQVHYIIVGDVFDLDVLGFW